MYPAQHWVPRRQIWSLYRQTLHVGSCADGPSHTLLALAQHWETRVHGRPTRRQFWHVFSLQADPRTPWWRDRPAAL